ncbi:MAG: sigma-54-dependent Fis family transcriptional regulator, partial [Flavobacteriales bacterium]|nr:sigma-54-dependent Fis family transcriptional regulator [Flavobacteriales bacterium]
GAFTGAHEARKGYFEVADGGTIFLDEVGELPLSTQARLLRILETGEFIKVGSSKVQKTNVRIVAATNVKLAEAVKKNKFREDLFYRLNTVPIVLPSLRERKEDIHLLFRKFASDFASKYRMPSIQLTPEATEMLIKYPWPGNIRQLKNVAEQISVIENNREISAAILSHYLPSDSTQTLPALYKGAENSDLSEREILYKVLFDLKDDVNELKKLVFGIMNSNKSNLTENDESDSLIKSIQRLYAKSTTEIEENGTPEVYKPKIITPEEAFDEHEDIEEESLSLADKEKEMILKSLQKHNNRRRKAAEELGISERTLYRKIKEYDINE